MALTANLYNLQCDRLCGEGKRHRKVTCYRKVDDKIRVLDDSECAGTPRPESTEQCAVRPCDGADWVATDWSGCKACGLETETRQVLCVSPKGQVVPNEYCHEYRKPESSRKCEKPTACEFRWYTSQWSEVNLNKIFEKNSSNE
jgi:papilin